jgi:HD-like signal output (HDOD) protein
MKPALGSRPPSPQPFSPVAVQVLRRVDDPECTVSEIAQLISLDPVLASSVLRLANSSFYGLSREVGSVADAVAVLGTRAAARLAACAALAEPLKAADASHARERWQHYAGTAVFARRLLAGDDALADLAFTAGLLSDVGQVHLLQRHGAAYLRLLDECTDDALLQREAEHFGQAHDLLGAALLDAWGLPAPVVDAVRHHHAARPLAQLTPLQQAVWLANRLAGSAEEQAQAVAAAPAGLCDPQQAMAQGLAEVDVLKQLLGG